MGTGLWQDGADQQVFHCLFILTFLLRGCRGSFYCLSFSSWDEAARLTCGGGGAIRSTNILLVGLRHPEMALQAAFRTESIFEACDDLLQPGDAYSAE